MSKCSSTAPFWARKDDGAWSIPKGEYIEGDDPSIAAQREFHVELGKPAPDGSCIHFAPLKQSSGKVFTAFAVSGNLNLEGTFSNTFELEWQRGSGRSGFPEIDRVGWFSVAEAQSKLLKVSSRCWTICLRALEGDAPAGSRSQ